MAEANPRAGARGGDGDVAQDTYRVIVGWKHHPMPKGIDLTLQTTDADRARNGAVDAHHLLMTRNQALILAKYLLDATGQQLPEPPRRGLLARWFG